MESLFDREKLILLTEQTCWLADCLKAKRGSEFSKQIDHVNRMIT
jgi:hypothetical protein